MVNNSIDYFKFINNFKKNELIKSILISGEVKKTTPKVSILIPTFKREIMLKEAVDSALKQINYEDYEIIIIDNNPERNCGTEKLIQKYSNDKILYYKNSTNLGMFGNWNRGFELSRSEWTVLLHDDDIISPYFLSTCCRFFNDKAIALLKPKIIKFTNKDELKFIKPPKSSLNRYYLFDFIYGCSIGAPTNILYNTSKLIATGGFNQDFFPCSDYVSSSLIAKRYKIYKLKCVLGGYRVSNNESLNEKTMDLYYENRYKISTYIMKYFKFPYFIISLIQSSWIEYLIKGINSFYGINIKYDYETKLELKKLNPIIGITLNIFCRIMIKITDQFRFRIS